MKQEILTMIAVLLFISGNALANGSACETSPLVKGKCFMVIGTLYSYNGLPPFLRIESKDKRLYQKAWGQVLQCNIFSAIKELWQDL